MPTITIQVGQAGNQLGSAWWSLLQRQHEQLSNGLLSREYFRTADRTCAPQKSSCFIPRTISVDSEAKVVRDWSSGDAKHQMHVLGHGGCGNNWACGYHFGSSTYSTASKSSAWSSTTETGSKIDQIMAGVRKEAETVGGVPDFLMMASLAGGTGSGTGSALLEALADEYPASTIAAAAVAPGHTGDCTVQSINSCLAMQHLAEYAHAVVLMDNQTLLNQLNSQIYNSSSSSGSSSRVTRLTASASKPSTAAAANSRVGKDRPTLVTAAAASSSVQPISGRACLAGVNQSAAEVMVGLLWPLAEEDGLCGRSNIRQLASTICGDPVTKFVEVCHVAQPAAAWNSSSSSTSSITVGTWSPKIKLLSSQLPRFDPYEPTRAVTTSAAMIISRGMPGTAAARQPAATGTIPSSLHTSSSSSSSSSWFSYDAYEASLARGSSSSAWQRGFTRAICSSWPYFTGGAADVHVGNSPAFVWSASKQGEPSMTAAVRRSSIGSFMHLSAERALQLCDAGAYMHWYEQYGCEQQMIREVADAVADMAAAYRA